MAIPNLNGIVNKFERYREDIRQLLLFGGDCFSEKMHVSWMLERLQEVNPDCFDQSLEKRMFNSH